MRELRGAGGSAIPVHLASPNGNSLPRDRLARWPALVGPCPAFAEASCRLGQMGCGALPAGLLFASIPGWGLPAPEDLPERLNALLLSAPAKFPIKSCIPH